MTRNLSLIDVPKLRGINQSHLRNIGQFSDGKNFVCHDGRLKTREGTKDYPGSFPFASPVLSLHHATTVGVSPRLIAESDGRLYRRIGEDGAWVQLIELGGNDYVSSTPWGTEDGVTYMIFANGNVYLYDVGANSISEMYNEEEGVDDTDLNFEFVTTFKGRVFGWHPNGVGANLLFFCGYNENEEIDVGFWPPDFAVDPTYGSATETILCVLPRRESLFILTDKRYALMYGSSEEDFDISFGGFIGVYDVRLADVVGDHVLWLGTDKRVYGYSGTTAYPVSAPIDEYLEAETDFTYAWAKSFGTQWRLHVPNIDDEYTTVYVFDSTDEEWYRWIIPTVLRCGATYKEGTSGPETVLHGTHDNNIIQYDATLDEDFGDEIETDFTIGPFDNESRDGKLRSLHITYHDKQKTKFVIYNSVDHKRLSRASTIRFKGTESVVTKRGRLRRKKGKNLYIKISSTDKVNELHKVTVAFVAGKVK